MAVTLHWDDLADEAVAAPRYAVVAPTAGIVVGETLFRLGASGIALWATLLTLVYCALAPLRFSEDSALYRAFALVPLLRLVGVAMPVFVEGTVYWLALVYASLLPGVYLAARSHGSLRPRFRPRLGALLFVPTVVAGAVLARVEYALVVSDALLTEQSLATLALFVLVMVVFVGFVEELLFRGVLQRSLEIHLGRWPGLVLSSTVFGLVSASPVAVGPVFGMGVGLFVGLVYDWTDSLLVVTTVRGTLNVFLFAVLPVYGSLVGFVGAW